MTGGTPGERSWLERPTYFALFTLAVVVATNAPYAIWWARTPAGASPLLNDFVNLGDLYTYISWMKQAEQGHVLFVNLFAPDEQPRVLFLPLFLLLGNLGRATGLPLPWTLHLGRVICSVLLIVAARWLCRTLLDDERSRLLAFLYLVLATGVPFWPEASPVSSMLDNTMFCASWALLIVGAGHWIRALAATEPGSGIAPAAIAGICNGALWVVHPYDAVSLHAVVLATALHRALARRSGAAAVAGRAGIAMAVAAPGCALVMGALASNPTLRSWATVPRIAGGWELTAWGSVALLGGIRLALRPRPRPELSIWVAAGLLLMFSPVPNARRYMQGLQAPLAILAAEAFAILDARGLRRLPRYLTVAAFPPAAVLLIADASPLVPHRYIPTCILQDLAQLESLPPGVVLAPPLLGNLLPGLSGRQVYLGHAELTPGFQEKLADATAFREGKISATELARRGVRYVLLEKGAPVPEGVVPLAPLRCLRLYEIPGPAGAL